jgi:hypothetical protein
MRAATACGCDTYTAWLPLISTSFAAAGAAAFFFAAASAAAVSFASTSAAPESAKHSLAYRISSEAPFRLAPCGQDTDCLLRLRTGFAGENLGIKLQLLCPCRRGRGSRQNKTPTDSYSVAVSSPWRGRVPSKSSSAKSGPLLKIPSRALGVFPTFGAEPVPVCFNTRCPASKSITLSFRFSRWPEN